MSTDAFTAVIGNMTRDAELRFTSSGQAVAEFGLAVNNRKFNKQTQEWEDGEGQFFDVTVWGQLAENVAQSVEKGNRVMVVGRLDFRAWEDKETGGKRSKVRIVADSVGPDLRWATAVVEKNERRGPQSQSSGGSSRSDYDPDEKPF